MSVGVGVAVYVSLGLGVWVAVGDGVSVGVGVMVGVLLISGDGVTVGDGNAVFVTIIRGVLVGSWAIRVASAVMSTVGVIRGMASPLHPAMNNKTISKTNMPRFDMRYFPLLKITLRPYYDTKKGFMPTTPIARSPYAEV